MAPGKWTDRLKWETNLIVKLAGPGLKDALRKYWRARTDAIYDVFNTGRSGRPRVCIAYMTAPYRIDAASPKFHNHPNLWQCMEIGKIFHEMGYIVDVVNRSSEQYVPRYPYDVFFNDTCSMMDNVIRHLPGNCVKIGYFTCQHWLDNNNAEYQRLQDLRKRKGRVLPPHRIWNPFFTDAKLDGAILIGNHVMRESYSHLTCPVYQVPVSVWDGMFHRAGRNWQTARKSFLWLGSGGAVHKGLDLLLDAFAQLPEFNLHVVGPLSGPFSDVYGPHLQESPNIHYHGFLDVCSDEFNAIATQCCGSIFPSCAEGTGSSNLVAMAKGLIPVISRECALDIGRSGIILKTCSMESITCAVLQISSLAELELEERSRAALEFVEKHHSRAAFSMSVKAAISNLLQSPEIENERTTIPG